MMMRAQTNIQTAANRSFRERQGSLILAGPPSRRSSGALLHLEFYAAETFQQIEQLAIGLDRQNHGTPLLPCPPRLGVGYTPLFRRRTASHDIPHPRSKKHSVHSRKPYPYRMFLFSNIIIPFLLYFSKGIGV